MLKSEIGNTKSIVYIPGGTEKIEKTKEKYVPAFREGFLKAGIKFEKEYVITLEMESDFAKEIIKNASFIMLLGGNPFNQKSMCEQLGIFDELKKYKGVMLGLSAGAMLMSKYIIVIPCSKEYPSFRIEEGLNLDGISIYPHNNISLDIYPDTLIVDDEVYKKDDLIKVANEYGNFYLIQDNIREDGKVDISIIKVVDGIVKSYIENFGKIWKATSKGIDLCKNIL